MSYRRFLSSAWKTGNGLIFIQYDSNHRRKAECRLDIARVVGADTRNDGYCSGNGYMVTWALGHLVSLAMPDTYGYTKTAAEDLPMLPDPFHLVSRQMRTDRGMVTDIAASKQLKVIESVFNRCDSIIVATDATRGGTYLPLDIRLPGVYETVQTPVDFLAY